MISLKHKAFLVFVKLSLLMGSLLFIAVSYSQEINNHQRYWIDHNKNGKIEPYENPLLSIEKRASDLLGRMSVEDKIGQINQYSRTAVFDEEGNFSLDKAIYLIQKKKIGSFLRIPSQSDPIDKVNIVNIIQALAKDTPLGIPVIFGDNCPYGYADMNGASIFPECIGMAASFDPVLVKEAALVTANESSAVGIGWIYAPNLDVARDPRWGRMCETFGEDPYLVSKMGQAQVSGFQGENLSINNTVMSCGKHFAGYANALGGINGNTVDISEMTLREVFLQPFKLAVDSGIASIMPAHSELNGVPCHINKNLLTDILRKEIGFSGIVISDYSDIERIYSVFNIAKSLADAGKLAIEAGVDVDMVGDWKEDVASNWSYDSAYGYEFMKYVQNGNVSKKLLDRAVSNILAAKFKLGLFDRELYIDPAKAEDNIKESYEKNRDLAYKLALESIVLLKNDNHLLPLNIDDIQSIAVIGPNADERESLFGMKYHNDVSKMVTILDGIKNVIKTHVNIYYAKGCSLEDMSKEGFNEAVNVAKASDVAIVVVGESCVKPKLNGEGRDTDNLNLRGVQEDLIKAIFETGVPTIVILVNGRPLTINWTAEHVPAILEAWFPGEEAGNAIADILFGKISPSGKLPVTFPVSVGQIPSFYNYKPRPPEGGYINTSDKPLYPFGYGLSYTNFEYKNLRISPYNATCNGSINIDVDISNSGNMEANEVVQLYVHKVWSSVVRPLKELKGFKRITLNAGETKTVHFTMKISELAYYNEDMKKVVEPGEFDVMIGSSSEDIRLNGIFKVANNCYYK